MLTIRQAQFTVLSQVEIRKFEKWMLGHLKRFFPPQCAVAGDEGLQEMVRRGIERAAVYGITAKRDVCKYIDLMTVFGSDFDTDSRTQWATAILGQRRSSSARMQALLTAAKAHLRNR